MRSAPTLRLFGLACLLVFLPLVAFGAGDEKPIEPVEKPKEKKPVDGEKPDKGGKDDKTKEEEKGGPPTLERYVELLKSDNVLVRKRATLVLMKKGPDAFPALLELELRERDPDLKKLLRKATGPDLYTTPEKVGALLKTLKDSSADAARRQVACTVLPALMLNPRAEPHRDEIKETLELVLADPSEDLQAAAARALEDIDNPEGLKERLRRRAAVRLVLDPAALRGLRLKAEDVVQAIQEQYPEFKARLADDYTLEATVTDEQRVVLMERLRLSGKGGIRLKDILSRERPAPASAEK